MRPHFDDPTRGHGLLGTPHTDWPHRAFPLPRNGWPGILRCGPRALARVALAPHRSLQASHDTENRNAENPGRPQREWFHWATSARWRISRDLPSMTYGSIRSAFACAVSKYLELEHRGESDVFSRTSSDTSDGARPAIPVAEARQRQRWAQRTQSVASGSFGNVLLHELNSA
jgi:hypothetical protein